MNNTKIFKKLNTINPKLIKKIGLDFKDIEDLKTLILNDKLGLKLNFKDTKEDLSKTNYILFKDKDPVSRERERERERETLLKSWNLNLKDKNNNLLIEGENYYVLKALKTTDIKIDVIYIDPPYNTGNEFIYNDKRITKDDSYTHSKWLSFMKKRLELARDLLKDDGIIFVSIDDNEQAYLKVLMDEIFGENNFIKTLIFKTNNSVMKFSKDFRKDHEYIHLYSKNKLFSIFSKLENKTIDFQNIDNDINGNWFSANATFKFEKNHKNTFCIELPNGKNIIRTWRFSIKDYKNNKINLYFKNDNVPRIKLYEKNYNKFNKIPSTLINLDLPINNKMDSFSIAKNELNLIFGKNHVGNSFETPKPTKLLKWLISKHIKKDILILDFFAGSGTTGQAVMELNQEDDGNRRFILVTNNENNICEKITYERLYRVINGKGSNNEKIDWKYSDKLPFLKNNSLRYLIIDLIDKFDGQYEYIDNKKDLYKIEFNKDISIKDFKD